MRELLHSLKVVMEISICFPPVVVRKPALNRQSFYSRERARDKAFVEEGELRNI